MSRECQAVCFNLLLIQNLLGRHDIFPDINAENWSWNVLGFTYSPADPRDCHAAAQRLTHFSFRGAYFNSKFVLPPTLAQYMPTTQRAGACSLPPFEHLHLIPHVQRGVPALVRSKAGLLLPIVNACLGDGAVTTQRARACFFSTIQVPPLDPRACNAASQRLSAARWACFLPMANARLGDGAVTTQRTGACSLPPFEYFHLIPACGSWHPSACPQQDGLASVHGQRMSEYCGPVLCSCCQAT